MRKILFFMIAVMALSSCGQMNKETDKNLVDAKENAKVKIYYFHGKQRCKSCVAIQKVAEEAYSENFKDNQDVTFREVDFTIKENDSLAEKYEVAWSSLVIASEHSHVNLTDIAFANALSNPQTLKDEIVKETNVLLNLNK